MIETFKSVDSVDCPHSLIQSAEDLIITKAESEETLPAYMNWDIGLLL